MYSTEAVEEKASLKKKKKKNRYINISLVFSKVVEVAHVAP